MRASVIVVIVFFLFSLNALAFDVDETGGARSRVFIRRIFTWPYIKNTIWQKEVYLLRADYLAEKHNPLDRSKRTLEFVLVSNPIRKLADSLARTAKEQGFLEYEFIMSFVQGVITYKAGTNIDPFKLPLETLVEGGDCEDKAGLAAALLKARGYDVFLVLLQGHMGIALEGDFVGVSPNYFYGGKKYYYVEASRSGWRLGELPERFHGPAVIITADGLLRVNTS